MTSYVLCCESTADLTKEHFETRDINFVKFHFSVDGNEYFDDLGETIPFNDFYQLIKNNADVKTAQVNISEYEAFWTPFLEKGLDIVHVCFSSGLSGTINSARNARSILLDKYPERKIYISDSLSASSGYGLLMDTAASKRDEGMTSEELYDWIEQNKLYVNHWFFSTDLSSYVKGGRISKTAAVFGGVLEICPLLNMDAEGHLVPRDKIRKKKNVIKEIVNRMIQYAENGTQYSGKCYISQSDCYDDAVEVAKLIEETFPNLNGKVEINWVGTTIGSHTGPGTVALFFWGKERT